MVEEKTSIVVIEDEAPIRRFLKTTLSAHDYDVIETVDGKTGIMAIAARKPAVVILDLGLPDMDGLDVLKEIREWSQVPIIILSAREQEGDKVKALDEGADDYLTKPFGVAELLARLRASTRRAGRFDEDAEQAVIEVGRVKIDQVKRLVYLNNEEVHLTPIEFKLLAVLVKHRGKVLTHYQILKDVWGKEYLGETQYLRVYMAQLRKKLEVDSANPHLLITEPGIGYRLKDD